MTIWEPVRHFNQCRSDCYGVNLLIYFNIVRYCQVLGPHVTPSQELQGICL